MVHRVTDTDLPHTPDPDCACDLCVAELADLREWAARRGASPSAASPDPGGDPRFDARASDVDPHHAYVDGCGCEHCLTTEAELRSWADEHRAAAVEHQERAFEVWPVAPPTVPWQLDHEPEAEALCAGVA